MGVGGTQSLRNVLGEALKGRFSFEARNYLFSFPSYVHFEEFFVSRAFVKFGAKRSSPGAFGFDDASSRMPGNHIHGIGLPATFVPGRRNVCEGCWAVDES